MKRVLIILTFYLAIQINCIAQRNKIRFEKLSIEEGLTQSSVVSICQDHKGFLWFGTYDGLVRYDGYEFKVFKNDPDDQTSLSENLVRVVYEDRAGNLWVGTEGGLNKFDRDKECFINYLTDPKNPNSLSNNRIRQIMEDKNGVVWIATEMGVNKFNRKLNSFTRIIHDANNFNSLSDNFVRAVFQDKKGYIWFGTNNGLDKFNEAKGLFIHYKNDPKDPTSIAENSISSIKEDHEGNLWVGLRNKGMSVLNPVTNKFKRYSANPNDPHSLKNTIRVSMYEDRSQNIWVATYGGGLFRYNRESDSFTNYVHDQNDYSSLSSNAIYCMTEDNAGILWIGTDFGGISKFDLRKNQFVYYSPEVSNPTGLHSNNIISFYEDPADVGKRIWLGTWGNGLCLFERDNEKFTFYTNNQKNLNSLSNNVVRSILKDKYGFFWIGTDNGLNKFNPKTNNFITFLHAPENPKSLSNNMIKTVFEDRDGDLWIATNGGGLELFDRSTNDFIHFRPDLQNPNSINDDIIWCMEEDKNGNLWLGTNSGGLNKFNKKTKVFSHYVKELNNPRSISNDKVLCISIDKNGIIWLGTAGGGLDRFDPDKEEFITFDQSSGLASNTVHSILDDGNGNLWISTTQGLSSFNKKKNTFINFDINDGLQGNEFHVNSVCRSITGEMFFGGTNGFNVFYPWKIHHQNFIPKIAITDFQIFNKPVPIHKEIDGREILKRSILETNNITLSYKDEIFTVQFASLDYTSPHENLYAYKLEGFDKEWNYIGKRNYASFTKLPAGRYNLLVKGSNHNGAWVKEPLVLGITIEAPFYEEWWFRSLIVIILIGTMTLAYKIRTSRIINYNLELEEHVTDRTKELNEANKELEAFSYSVSHDLRAPLRAIDGYSKIFIEDYGDKVDEEGKQLLASISRNSKRMGFLINDLLQFSRIGRAEIRPQLIESEALIDSILNELIDNVNRSRYDISINDLPKIYADQMLLRIVWTNLISNAIKFTSKKDSPRIEIGSYNEETRKIYYVKDNGVGFDQQKESNIFEIFKQFDDDEFQDSRIGLAIINRIVKKHRGEFWAEGELNRGSTFYFTINLDEP